MTTIVVTDDQVESAKALVAISGGPDKVDPLIAKIASAKPRTDKSHGTRKIS